MARLARLLNPHCRVLRYDRRGYARSWPHSGPFGVPDQVEDLVGLLGDDRAVLVGHSYGGNVALATAVALPRDRVVGVSVYETPLSWLPWWPRNTAGGRSVAVPSEDAAEAFMRRLVGDRGWEALPERTRQQRRREGLALQGELSWLREHQPWSPADITFPLLCGSGSRGSEHHARGMEWLARESGGRHIVIEGAGHGAHNSHPVEFVRTLIEPHLSR